VKQNHVLIDYGNVQPEVAAALAQPVFKVLVFVGVQKPWPSLNRVDRADAAQFTETLRVMSAMPLESLCPNFASSLTVTFAITGRANTLAGPVNDN
jgi:hypothetical protein